MIQYILQRKYALSILILSYASGPMNTSAMIRSLRGHPAVVLDTIRDLESLGLLRRSVVLAERRSLEIRLTVKGIELMDTALSHWDRLVRKWDSVRVESPRFTK